MGRLGVQCEDFSDLLEHVIGYKNITIEGFFTHLANADDVDPKISQEQIVKFSNILKVIKTKKFSKLHNSNKPILIHSANSAGLLRYPESRFNLVRPGISLYGSFPSPVLKPVLDMIKNNNYPALRPVMSWKTKIIQVQTLRKGVPLSYGGSYITKKNKSRIAILPVGYADGLNRRLSNKMEFLVKGMRVKQIGTICMDMCLIDVTELPSVEMGEEVVILGSQGKDNIPIEELADKAETIPYEIFCGISKRVPRVYV
jgi:alanine racemase